MIWKIIDVHPSQCLRKLDETISLEFRSVMIMQNLNRVRDHNSCVNAVNRNYCLKVRGYREDCRE